MNLKYYSHRYGWEIVNGEKDVKLVLDEFLSALQSITDEEIIERFEHEKYDNGRKDKSISIVLNSLIKERLVTLGWKTESFIFKDKRINATTRDWRLDFVYEDMFSVEVAFNHGSSTAVNLLKPVLASELNHIEKEYQTKFGIIVTATNEMKRAGGFDNAIGTFEGYIEQSRALMNQLTVPLIIIGIDAPDTFIIKHEKEGSRQVGNVKRI